MAFEVITSLYALGPDDREDPKPVNGLILADESIRGGVG